MPPGRHASGLDRAGEAQHLTSTIRGNPRRRSVAIQDLLNPVSGENRADVCQACSNSGFYSSNDQGRQRDGQSSPEVVSHLSAQERFSPASFSGSEAPSTSRERRDFRPPYTEEEINFIWYHREDLQWDWKAVRDAFNCQFPNRKESGIQCKYYRHLESHGVPQVRRRDRTASATRKYNMRTNTGLQYPWMH
ncbi:MAG: hypothetical protein Q9219_004151 [cf. Caloplaca sp. 3 TL-2023]